MRMILSRCGPLACALALATVLGAGVSRGAERGAPAPERIDPSAGCATGECHGSTVGHEQLHWPNLREDCRDCHSQQGDRHAFSMEPRPDLCLVCHDAILESGHVHDAAREDCVDCHDPHGSKHPTLLVEAQPELCFLCHDETEVLRGEVKHRPVGEGKCSACHDPHASPHPALLVAAGRELCEGCHDDIRALLQQQPHWHQPLRESGCEKCHTPHASEHAWLLKESFPRSIYAGFDPERYQLCFGCHAAGLVTDERTRSSTGFRDGERNLHYLHVHKSSRGRSCRACHDPHASPNSHQVGETVDYGGWQMPVGFKPHETGGSCAPGCHAAATYERGR